MNVHEKEVAHEICELYKTELQKAVDDPTYAGSTHAQTLSSKEASYLTTLFKGVTLSFACRYPDCLFFGQNDGMTWPEEHGHYRFRCPSRGRKAQPWTTMSGQVQGLGFVLTITDPITEEVTHIPTVWPPTQDEQWVNNMIEMTARDIKTAEDAQAWRSKSALDLHELIQRARIPKAFKAIPWKPENEHMLTKFKWQQIAERGFFYGDYLDTAVLSQGIYSNWSELINSCANHVAATRAVIARM